MSKQQTKSNNPEPNGAHQENLAHLTLPVKPSLPIRHTVPNRLETDSLRSLDIL